VNTYRATVLGRRRLSSHLVSISLAVEGDFTTTSIPDEYLRVMIAPEGAELVLPEIDENYTVTYPEGAVEPESRVYTVSDHRIVDGVVNLDIDIALHEVGVGSDWARSCEPGDQVGLTEAHGLYKAPADVAWQLLVCDITGVPAVARILRGLSPEQKVDVHIVLTDPGDEVPLPSPADVNITWQVVEDERYISEALSDVVLNWNMPDDGRYVWLAGEARASRAARKHLRRTLGWSQSDFYTCGYWQLDAEKWNARYEEVAEQLQPEFQEVAKLAETDEGRYLDAIDEIYERVGL